MSKNYNKQHRRFDNVESSIRDKLKHYDYEQYSIIFRYSKRHWYPDGSDRFQTSVIKFGYQHIFDRKTKQQEDLIKYILKHADFSLLRSITDKLFRYSAHNVSADLQLNLISYLIKNSEPYKNRFSFAELKYIASATVSTLIRILGSNYS